MTSSRRLEIADQISDEQLWRHLVEVSKGNRLSGSEDERRCHDYMAHVLASFGYRIERLAPETLIGVPLSASLQILSPEPIAVECHTYAYSPSTPTAGLEADVVYVGNGAPGAYPAAGLCGAIALSDGPGESAKAVAADAAGAGGHIHINHDAHLRDGIISPIWGSPAVDDAGLLPRAPAVVIRHDDGQRLKELVRLGPVRVRIHVKTRLEWQPTPILVADLPGAVDDMFAIFSAHSDSWGMGAMDNGSGNAVQLEVARVIATDRDRLKRGLRIIVWSGHSHGRYSGSAWYADNRYLELLGRCVCHVNADAIGAVGADNLRLVPTLAETYEFAHGVIAEVAGVEISYRRMPSRMSEQSFLHMGVPSCFATLSEQPEGGFGWWIHTPDDTLDKVSHANLLRDGRIYAATLWDLCTRDFLPFDFRRTAAEMRETMSQLQARFGRRLDLSAPIEVAWRLEREIDALGMLSDPVRHNRLLLDLSHVLNPVNYSRRGPYHQDPAVNPHPPMPGLALIEGLDGCPAGSDAERMQLVELTRQRNRVAVALEEAVRLVREASARTQ